MIKPTIHLNGTSAKDLYEQYSNAIAALRDSLVALTNAAPNGRDYYPQGASVIYTAVDEHKARMMSIVAVISELEQLQAHVAEAL